MTVLNWVLAEDMVVVASDTLVVNAKDSSPMFFSAKIFPVAHAGTLITGTGVSNCISQATFAIATQSVCRHVLDIDNGLPQLLRETSVGVPDKMSSTAYVFGWDADQERMRGFAYRSSNEFTSEELSYGLGIKPQIAFNEDSIEPFEPFFIELIARQKQAEEAKLIADRVYIGGEIIMAELTRGGLSMRTIHRFDDYEIMFNEAVSKLSEESS